MACRLFGAKPLPEPMVTYCQLGKNFNELKYKIFIHKNAFENVVCEMADTLSWGEELMCKPESTKPIKVARQDFLSTVGSRKRPGRLGILKSSKTDGCVVFTTERCQVWLSFSIGCYYSSMLLLQRQILFHWLFTISNFLVVWQSSWISDYIHNFLWDVIIHPCSNFNGCPKKKTPWAWC